MNKAGNSQPLWRYKPFLLEVSYGLIAAVISLVFLQQGWSAFDDGYYAWIAQRLVDGATLHGDIVSNHPGYANYLHAGLFLFFGEQLSVLRTPHPMLSLLLVTSIARMARSSGLLAQGISAFCAATLGIIQWNTPSAGWFSVALAAASIATFCKAYTSDTRRTWLLLSGILLGLCAGFRQHNGVLLAVGMVVLHSKLAIAPVKIELPKWQQALSFVSLAVALFFVVYPVIFSPEVSTLLVLLPAIMCVAFAMKAWLDYTTTRNVEWLYPIVLGCAIGFLPVVLVAAVKGTLPGFFTDTIMSAQVFVHASELKGTSFSLLLSDVLELLAKGSIYAWANALFMTLTSVLPLVLATLMYLRRDKIREPFTAGLIVLAAISLPINAIFQSVLYAYYWLPAVTATLVVLVSAKTDRISRFLLPLGIVFPTFALIFHAGRIPGGNFGDVMSEPFGAQVACTLPHCDLWVSPQLLNEVSEDYRDIIANVPTSRPLLILPDGVSLYPFLQNSTPWRLGSLRAGLTPDREIARINDQVKNTPGTVVVVSQTEFKQATRLDEFIGSLCLSGQTARYRRYEKCSNPAR